MTRGGRVVASHFDKVTFVYESQYSERPQGDDLVIL